LARDEILEGTNDRGKIITFEASPKNCDIIEKNIRQNNLQNVVVERNAVGSQRGKITINDMSNSSITMNGIGVEVEMTCLDEYDHLNPSFLKIDVEGFEVQVLQGARRIMTKRPKLAIEIHTEDLPRYGASVDDLFRSIGVENYKFWVQWEDGKYPEEYNVGTPIGKRVHLFGIPIKQ
jgi:FkbM family methyltransferase